MSERFSVLIADDHPVIRRGVRHILSEASDVSDIGEAASPHEVLAMVRSRPWQVVVLDISMPGRGGLDVLKELREEFPGCVHLHHDNGDSEQAMDLWGLFERPRKAHVYCCGPKGLMDSVRDMTGHWTAGTVHFESFGVDSRIQAVNSPFTVRLQRSGTRIEVASHESMLDALRRHGTQVSSSCESGTCGSCRTRVLAGEPDHRDLVLSDEEKSSYVIVCTSRSRTPELVLDL